MYRANPRVNVELRQRLPSPDRRSVSPSVSPVLQRRSVSPPVSPPSSRTPGRVGLMDEDRPPSRGPSPRDEGGASRGHLVPGGDSPRLISPLTLDRDKNTSLLLKELDALREINAKLQEQLVQKEKELQSREVEEELREQQREAHDWGRAAVVLEEVLAAQKDRDQAVMSRLLLANQERDEALTLARRLQEAAQAEDVDLDDCDMDVDELLRCVCGADSVQDLQRFGSVLVQRLRLARQRRQDITAQEMKAVMEERDESVAKWKLLEQDLLQERRPMVNEEELLRLQKERDRALEDRRRLEAELQELRANQRSQGRVDDVSHAPPPQGHLPHAPPPQGHLAQDPPPQPQAPPPQPQAPSLLVQLQQLSQEKQSMEAELQRCQEAEQQASERVRRLERLVEVLRKKLGTGNLRSVV